jgi:hypothetical protein
MSRSRPSRPASTTSGRPGPPSSRNPAGRLTPRGTWSPRAASRASVWTVTSIVSTRIVVARCDRKSTSPMTLARVSSTATVTDISGTNSARPEAALRTVRSTTTAKVNVARNSARVRWTTRSRVNVRSRRGENWLLASWRVTTVSEKVSAVTVISEPAMVPSTERAASAPRPNRYPVSPSGSTVTASSWGSATPRTTASATPRVGSGHTCVVRASRRPIAAWRRAPLPTARGPVGAQGHPSGR